MLTMVMALMNIASASHCVHTLFITDKVELKILWHVCMKLAWFITQVYLQFMTKKQKKNAWNISNLVKSLIIQIQWYQISDDQHVVLMYYSWLRAEKSRALDFLQFIPWIANYKPSEKEKWYVIKVCLSLSYDDNMDLELICSLLMNVIST